MHCAALCGLVVLQASAGAQVKTVETPAPPAAFASYGPPEPVELSLVAWTLLPR